MTDYLPFRLLVAAAALRVSPLTLEELDVDWTSFQTTEARLNELRVRMVTDMASYPARIRSEILTTTWARDMIREEMVAARAGGAAPAGLLVEDVSDEEVEEDEDEDGDEGTEPVAASTATARLIVGSDQTPDLFANTSIDDSWVRPYRLRHVHRTTDGDGGSTVQDFRRPDVPEDNASSDGEEADGGGEDCEANFEAQQWLDMEEDEA